MRYFVSAGHHPTAPGAVWRTFVEHDEAVIWRDDLCAALGDRAMTVPTGVLREKVAFINTRVQPGDCAIEIHFNAARDDNNNPVGRGSETLYYPGSAKGKELALRCQGALAGIFQPDRGVKEGWYRMDPSRGPDFFLAKTACPAVILEPEFVHHFEKIKAERPATIDALHQALVMDRASPDARRSIPT